MLRCEQESSQELLSAIVQFNEGDWMGAHRILDKLYMEEKGEVRRFLQAVIQVGAALINWERGNLDGALTLLDRVALHMAEVDRTAKGSTSPISPDKPRGFGRRCKRSTRGIPASSILPLSRC